MSDAAAAIIITHPNGLPMEINIGNLWELGNFPKNPILLCGLSPKVVFEIFKADNWFNPSNGETFKDRAVIIEWDGYVFTCTKVPVGTPGSIQIPAFTKEGRDAVFKNCNTLVTNELMAAMLFSASTFKS